MSLRHGPVFFSRPAQSGGSDAVRQVTGHVPAGA